MQDEYREYAERLQGFDSEEAFALLERDSRRYNKAFTEEEEAKRV